MSNTDQLHHIIDQLHKDNCNTRLAAHRAISMLNDALDALRYGSPDVAEEFIDRTITDLARAINPRN